MLTAPRYSRVGERGVDGEISKLERRTTKKSQLEERHHGFSTSSIVLAKESREHENNPTLQKRIGKELGTK